MTKKKTDPYSLRIDGELKMRIERISKKSGLAKAAILQLCVRAGLPLLESGKVNLIATEPYSIEELKTPRSDDSAKKSASS